MRKAVHMVRTSIYWGKKIIKWPFLEYKTKTGVETSYITKIISNDCWFMKILCQFLVYLAPLESIFYNLSDSML